MTESAITEELIYTFNIVHLLKFLGKNGFLTTAVVAVLSYRLSDLATELYHSIIQPIFNIKLGTKKEKNDNGEYEEIDYRLEHHHFNIWGVKIKIGESLLSILKFICILYIIFMVAFLIDFITKNI